MLATSHIYSPYIFKEPADLSRTNRSLEILPTHHHAEAQVFVSCDRVTGDI